MRDVCVLYSYLYVHTHTCTVCMHRPTKSMRVSNLRRQVILFTNELTMVFRHTYRVAGGPGGQILAREKWKIRGEGWRSEIGCNDRPLEFAYLGKLEKGKKNLLLDRRTDWSQRGVERCSLACPRNGYHLDGNLIQATKMKMENASSFVFAGN